MFLISGIGQDIAAGRTWYGIAFYAIVMLEYLNGEHDH